MDNQQTDNLIKFIEDQSPSNTISMQKMQDSAWHKIEKKIAIDNTKSKFSWIFNLSLGLALVFIIMVMIVPKNDQPILSEPTIVAENPTKIPNSTIIPTEVQPTLPELITASYVDNEIDSILLAIDSEFSQAEFESDFPEINIDI